MLLLVQINALRYQGNLITNVQRIWLLLDLAVLVWFFARNPLDTVDDARVPWRRILRSGLRIGLPALVIGLNFLWLGPLNGRIADSGVFCAGEDLCWDLNPLDLACRRWTWGCRFLRVADRTLVNKVWDDKAMTTLRAGGAEAAKALAGIEGVVLYHRSLRFAVLYRSRLYAAYLMDADLTGADLGNADLTGANLNSADLTAANLDGAKLDGADLHDALIEQIQLDKACGDNVTLDPGLTITPCPKGYSPGNAN